jgi:hypothetical protein
MVAMKDDNLEILMVDYLEIQMVVDLEMLMVDYLVMNLVQMIIIYDYLKTLDY